MTVATEQSSIQFVGIIDGVPLAVPFPVQATSDLKVYHHGSTLAVEGVDYSVALVAPDYLTASVTPLPGFAVTSAGNVTVQREVTYTQPTNLVLSPSLMLSRLTQMVDRVVFITQQLRDKLGNALSYQVADPAASKGALPLQAARANKFLAFDANGLPIASPVAAATTGTPMTAFGNAWTQLMAVADALVYLGFTTVGAFGKTLVATATAAAARATMAVPGLGDNNAFTGANTFPTQAVGDNTQQAATDAFVQAAVGKVYLQTFTVSGNYVPHAGLVKCVIECISGGGGGGGMASAAAGAGSGGGGGGAGGRSVRVATAANIGASQVVTIGAAGAGGAAGANNGTAGGDTSVGVLCISKGGGGGAGGSTTVGGQPGGGGVVGTGDVAAPGAPGMAAAVTTSGNVGVSGGGGSGPYGSGGPGKVTATAVAGDAASGFGAGGSGGASYNAGGAAAGGAGSAGLVLIWEFCNQ